MRTVSAYRQIVYDYTLIKQVDSGRYRIIIRAKVLPPYVFATGLTTVENRISYEFGQSRRISIR